MYLSGTPFEELDFPTVGRAGPPRLSESIQHGVFAYFMPPVAWCGILALASLLTRPGEAPKPAPTVAAPEAAGSERH